MWPSMTLLVVVVAVLVLRRVDATVETTCKAAAISDKRVNYEFCLTELNKHHQRPDVDEWSLAQAAAEMGTDNADSATHEIIALLAKPGTNTKATIALEQCEELYSKMALAFIGAHDDINSRNYTVGKEKAEEAIPLAHQCDDSFVKAAVRSPLAQRDSYSMQIAIVCAAITNLIK